jgi:hypothetical protein
VRRQVPVRRRRRGGGGRPSPRYVSTDRVEGELAKREAPPSGGASTVHTANSRAKARYSHLAAPANRYRRSVWPGFNPAVRGFGGEEDSIYEKFRQAGGRCLCLPWVRWVHRFSRPSGVPYPLLVKEKLRISLSGCTELGLDPTPALEHFAQHLPPETIAAVEREALASGISAPPGAALAGGGEGISPATSGAGQAGISSRPSEQPGASTADATSSRKRSRCSGGRSRRARGRS